MLNINATLRELQFGITHYIENRASIADLFKPNKRCGIYVLHFATGEYYVGQAVDVTRRYVQHSKNHTDIQQISFQEVTQDSLNEVERKVIGIFERRGFQMRNIALTSIPKGESDFDLVLPEEAQNEWINNFKVIHLDGKRPIDPNLRRKYQRHYERLMCKKGADQAVVALRKYVQKGIPAIKSSELSFWSCSCLPAFKVSDITLFSRINIYWQEVFTVYATNGQLGFSWHLALTPLEQAFGPKLTGLERRYPNLGIDLKHQYKPGGPDQVNVRIENVDLALKLMNDRDVLRAVRLFNLRLMKKGACAYSRYHCFALADKLYQPHD